MNRKRRIFPACLLAAAVTGCGTGVREPQHYHVLEPWPASTQMQVPLAPAAHAPALLVTPTATADFYDAQAIVYSPRPGTRAYYQLNSWTEPPGGRVVASLTERLRHTNAFAAVINAAGEAPGALVLDTQLDEIYHDASSPPGYARISLIATLSDPARRAFVGQRRFTASVALLTPGADGAVRAFDIALGSLLDDMTAWVEQTAGTAGASRE